MGFCRQSRGNEVVFMTDAGSHEDARCCRRVERLGQEHRRR
jgi:hypothetical protein